MFPMSYEYALFVRLKLKMRTTFCGDVVIMFCGDVELRSDLFKCVSHYIPMVSLLNMDFHKRTLILLGKPCLDIEPCAQLRLMCGASLIVHKMYTRRLSFETLH